MATNHVTFLLATFVFLVHFAESATDPSDVLPLQNMFSAFNSPPQLTNWNSDDSGDPCLESWKGITCKGNSVVSIVVPGLGLNGTMGYMLSNLMSLETLDMSHNNIYGPIPYQLPANLTTLNLASNNFSGDLAYSISYMVYLTFLNVSHNVLSRLADDLFCNLVHLKTLDLSFNNFTGNLPTSLNSLSHVSTIYVQNNHLSGTLNVLSGLPLTNLNVADNNFSGLIPRKISSIPNFIFHGNSFDNTSVSLPRPHSPPPPRSPPPHSPLLGGDNSSHRAPPSQTPTSYNIPISREARKGLKVGVLVCIVVGSILGALAAVVALVFCVCKSRRRGASPGPGAATVTRSVDTDKADTEVPEQQAENVAAEGDLQHPQEVKLPGDSVTEKSESTNRRVKLSITSFSLASLQTATNSFNKEFLIGEGSLGRVYKAEFSNGTVMAVKKIDNVTSSLQDEDCFLEAVSNMSRLRHRNIVTLAGYSAEYGQRLLVYQYIGNRNLHDMLHLVDCSRTLSWNARVRIALGTARALEYLHEVSLPSVVHRNFKSANILLDEELNPHLSDCGLAALTPYTAQQMSAEMVGSFGYSAPEFAMSGMYTVKSDVYSFGVVMLELMTGRKPLDSSRVRSEQSLVRWASPLLHDVDALARMIDPLLNGMYPAKSLSRFADIIALCVQPEPEFRPPMSEVVQALVRLMQRTSTVLCRSPQS